MPVTSGYRQRTKAEAQEKIEHTKLAIKRHKANISDETLYLKAAEAALEKYEQERDMAIN